MTDRIFALSVALTDNIREDDVQVLVEAIKLFRGVASVSMHVADITLWTAHERARLDLSRRVIAALTDEGGGT